MTIPQKHLNGETFADWLDRVMPEISAAQVLMSKTLSDNPPVLTRQLMDAEAYYARTANILAEANGWLDTVEYIALMGIDQELKVMEREIRLKATVAQERMLRDKTQGLLDAIKNRTILGMAIMKAQSNEPRGHS